MLPYTTRGRASDARDSQELKRSCTYDLLSVVEHVGEIDTGELTFKDIPSIIADQDRTLRYLFSSRRAGEL